MKINKIIKLKNNKYKIMIDDEIIVTFDNVILENNLLYKKVIDNELYKIIINDTNYYDIYNKVVNYILKKRRSQKEINEYLIKFNLSQIDKDKIISKLKNNNLINDIEYCRAYINDNLYLSKSGLNKIKKDLFKHNIPTEVIETQLDKIDKNFINNKLEKLIIKRINLNKKYSNNLLKEKMLSEMINLGYDKNHIITIIDSNLKDDELILENEFEKLYLKMSKKYSNNELIKNVRNKMIMKGFSITEINKLIIKKTEK